MNFDDVKHKALDIVDAIRTDPAKRRVAVYAGLFLAGFVVAKLFA